MGSFETFWSIYSNLVLTIGTNALLALSIYLTLSCGMLTLANAAFMGIGAYTSTILTVNLGMPFAVAIGAGMLAAAAIAWILGRFTLRLSGVYLAMATLAFGEVMRIVILNMEGITGGALGINGIPQSTQWWHIASALVITLFVLSRMHRSKVGRAFAAIKEDETAAGMMGIDVNGHKQLAFVLGGLFAGVAGALNAHLTFFIAPNEYGFDRAVEILTMAILGGISGLTGPVMGAALLTLLPELLRGLKDFRLVINGLLLVVIVLFLSKGLWDPVRFKSWLTLATRSTR